MKNASNLQRQKKQFPRTMIVKTKSLNPSREIPFRNLWFEILELKLIERN